MSSALRRCLILILLTAPVAAFAAAAGEDAPVNAAASDTLVKDRHAVRKYVEDLLGDGPVPSVPAKTTHAADHAGK